MISSETATFMKWGGLGMVASELPEAFNNCFGQNGDVLTVVTPMYLGDTGKKKGRAEWQCLLRCRASFLRSEKNQDD